MSISDEWNIISQQATKTLEDIKEHLPISNKTIEQQLTFNQENNNLLDNEINKELLIQKSNENIDNFKKGNISEQDLIDNAEDEDYELLEEELAKDEALKQQQIEIQKMIDIFHKREFPEETLPDFSLNEITLEDLEKMNETPLIHDFDMSKRKTLEGVQDCYYSHLSFISDYFPINNLGISRLIKSVRFYLKQENINDNGKNTILTIYKLWLFQLKQFNKNYHLYDWRNFNDNGEFILENINDDLDQFIVDIPEIILYDALSDKEKLEIEFQHYVQELFSSGKYESSIDPDLGNSLKQRTVNEALLDHNINNVNNNYLSDDNNSSSLIKDDPNNSSTKNSIQNNQEENNTINTKIDNNQSINNEINEKLPIDKQKILSIDEDGFVTLKNKF